MIEETAPTPAPPVAFPLRKLTGIPELLDILHELNGRLPMHQVPFPLLNITLIAVDNLFKEEVIARFTDQWPRNSLYFQVLNQRGKLLDTRLYLIRQGVYTLREPKQLIQEVEEVCDLAHNFFQDPITPNA